MLAAAAVVTLAAQTTPVSGTRYPRLAIRNAMIVEGVGTPASGPRDIIIEGGVIEQITPHNPSRPPRADAVIDAGGRYVLPGFINLHGHIHEERAGIPQEAEYVLKLWLACGITTVRDVGGTFKRSLELRGLSARHAIGAPRLFVYPFFSGARTPDEARARIREFKQQGADGVKFLGTYRDILDAATAEARALGLRTAHHIGVEETTAWDVIRNRGTSIEHWYGIPDAAIAARVQNFPAGYNYSNELDRFRYAGRLWREANPERLHKVLDAMVEAGVAWDPTLAIYEASRDLLRAQNQPWFADSLHPALAEFFKPNLASHGSFFLNWTTTDEAYWRHNYRLWMDALVEFERRGGLIGAGEDAGYIYQMYGFGYLRTLELHEEAGFHPLRVIAHATHNGARVLGEEGRLGRVREGWAADLVVVNGNPLENLKLLYPTSVEVVRDGKTVRTGGIAWTIRDGLPYDAARLFGDVKDLVASARKNARTRRAAQ